jgi:hypothetical protein
MKSKMIVLAALSVVLADTPTRAQVTVDVAKITCRQYLAYTVTDPRFIAIWLSGYYNGKRDNMVIDTGAFKTNVDKVQDYCRLNLNETVVHAVQMSFGIDLGK